MSSAGYKRPREYDLDEGLPYDAESDAPSSSQDGSVRRDKPKDWRDAFLDEDRDENRRERDRRSSERERDGGIHRGHGGRGGGGQRSYREEKEDRDRRRNEDRHPSKNIVRDRSRGLSIGAGAEAEDGEITDKLPSPAPSLRSHHTRSPSPSRRRRTRTPSPGGRPRRPYDPPPPRSDYSPGPRGGERGNIGGDRGRGSGYDRGGRGGGQRGGRGGPPYSSAGAGGRYADPYYSQNDRSRYPPPPQSELPVVEPPKIPPKIVEPPRDEMIEELPDEQVMSPEELIAERKRKRQQILEKFATSSDPGALTASGVSSAVPLATPSANGLSTAPSRGVSPSVPPTPVNFDLAKKDDASVPVDGAQKTMFHSVSNVEEEISAADWDPSADQRAEDVRRLQLVTSRNDAKSAETLVAETNAAVKKEEQQQAVSAAVTVQDDDDSDDDMFSGVIKEKKPVTAATGAVAVPMITRTAPTLPTATLADNWDDADGYYRIILGEVINDGRYHVFSNLGKGMFSAVVKARVLIGSDSEPEGSEVAIKIIRSQESMYKAGLKEIQILNRLRAADPDDKKHVVRLMRTFEHRGHLCMVFEMLSMNLRDVIKRFGKDVGLNIRAVRAYSHQMFLALSLMHKCKVMHADIKPDNILVTENKSVLKVCDLGSASDESENDITPYLVSRFYRAPEIILGLPYDCSLDMWSIGCTLYELYTGKILFPGRTNNQMLLHMMELKGKVPHRLIKKSQFGSMHFDESNNFISVEIDKLTGQNIPKTITSFLARDLKSRLVPSSAAQQRMKDDELKALLAFVDLLDKCLALDPAKRITPRDALLHPFLRP